VTVLQTATVRWSVISWASSAIDCSVTKWQATSARGWWSPFGDLRYIGLMAGIIRKIHAKDQFDSYIFLYFWMTWRNLINRQQIFGGWNLHKPKRQNGGESVWVCCSAVSRRHTGCSSLYTQHWIDVVGDRLHPPLRRRPSCPEPSHRSPTLGISLDGCTTGLISPDLAGTNSIMECVDRKRRPSIQSARICLGVTDNDLPARRGLTRCHYFSP